MDDELNVKKLVVELEKNKTENIEGAQKIKVENTDATAKTPTETVNSAELKPIQTEKIMANSEPKVEKTAAPEDPIKVELNNQANELTSEEGQSQLTTKVTDSGTSQKVKEKAVKKKWSFKNLSFFKSKKTHRSSVDKNDSKTTTDNNEAGRPPL